MTSPLLLVAIGVIFLVGLGLDKLEHIVHVPRVTMLILLGAVVGPPVLDLLPSALSGTSEIYASTALTMVAFLLGGVLKRDILRTHGRTIIIVSLSVVISSVAFVTAGLWAFGVPLALALMLGGPVTYLCRSECSFRPPGVRRPRGFFLPMLKCRRRDYRSR